MLASVNAKYILCKLSDSGEICTTQTVWAQIRFDISLDQVWIHIV